MSTEKNPVIWVVIPTYNESRNLKAIVTRVRAAGHYNILIVDDNSPDGTGDMADQLHQQLGDEVQVLHRTKKEGLGPAYRHGLAHALSLGADIVCHLDADLSHAPELLPTMIAAMDQADLVIASRYIPGGSFPIQWSRRWISWLGNVYIRLLLGWSVRDWSTGFKAWRATTLKAVLAEPQVSTGYACLMEMTWLARRQHARIKEVPLVFVDRTEGDSKFTWSIAVEDIRLAWQFRFRHRGLAKSQKT